jgi:predicted RNA-binding protein with PIN domain
MRSSPLAAMPQIIARPFAKTDISSVPTGSMLLYLRKADETMRYLVDGHNLIPNLPDLGLELLDDEVELVQRLQAFCGQGAHHIDVYFDNAPAGQAGTRRYGRVTAYFVRAGRTADAAIAQRLTALGRSARQWCVVSSDRSVQAAARAAQAEVLTSQAFVLRMQPAPGVPAVEPREIPPEPGEVDEWLRIFEEKRASTQRPSVPGKRQDS